MLEKIPSIIGQALQGVRPGPEKAVAFKDFSDVPDSIRVESPAFGHGAAMPVDHTEDGAKLSPPLAWSDVPSGTVEVALIVEDVDSPTPSPLVHALAYGLPPSGQIATGAMASAGHAPGSVHLGKNSFMKPEFLMPDPPSGHGTHRYLFQVFALSRPSGLSGEPGRGEVVEALQGSVIAKGVLIGTYERA